MESSLYELRNAVKDKESFIRFVEALADERGRAAEVERANPDAQYGGTLGWENGTISSFLRASMVYLDSRPFHGPEAEPSWKMFAEFLYFGKIYE